MKVIILTLLTGILFGAIDILPMLKMKLDIFSIVSAFVFYLVVPFVVYNTNLFGIPWQLRGGAITLLMALPIIILTAKNGIQNTVPIAVMSIVLGTLISIWGRFVIKVL